MNIKAAILCDGPAHDKLVSSQLSNLRTRGVNKLVSFQLSDLCAGVVNSNVTKPTQDVRRVRVWIQGRPMPLTVLRTIHRDPPHRDHHRSPWSFLCPLLTTEPLVARRC